MMTELSSGSVWEGTSCRSRNDVTACRHRHPPFSLAGAERRGGGRGPSLVEADAGDDVDAAARAGGRGERGELPRPDGARHAQAGRLQVLHAARAEEARGHQPLAGRAVRRHQHHARPKVRGRVLGVGGGVGVREGWDEGRVSVRGVGVVWRSSGVVRWWGEVRGWRLLRGG